MAEAARKLEHPDKQTPVWLKIFQPKVEFYTLLENQAATTLEGIRGLDQWLKDGACGECTVVHEMEHKADLQKRNVEHSLRDNFVTPFDREDIYDISDQLDLIINGAKKFAKDIEYFQDNENTKLDDNYLGEMSAVLIVGVEHIFNAIKNLEKNLEESEKAANEARKAETQLAKVYRKAMKDLYNKKDTNQLVRGKQLYDYLALIAERTERLGEKILHISIKNS